MVILDNSSTETTMRSSMTRTISKKSSRRPLDFNTLYNDNSATREDLERQENAALLNRISSGVNLVSSSVLLQANYLEDHEEEDEIEHPQTEDEDKDQDGCVQSVQSTTTNVQDGINNILCLTHFKYGSVNFLLDESDSFKYKFSKYLTDSQPSEEDIRSNFEESLLRRYIGRTLNGWDQQGLHYWLHKVCNSNLCLPLIEEITDGSWYRIHMCDKCINRLNTCHHYRFISQQNLDDTDDESFLYATNFSNSTSSVYFNKQNDIYCVKDFTNLWNYELDMIRNSRENLEFHNQEQCSSQHFQRLVYGYDTCGLHFNMHDVKEANQKNSNEITDNPNEINQFVNVVVYGTDPCGLKFPIYESVNNVGDCRLPSIISGEHFVEVTNAGDATHIETASGQTINESLLEDQPDSTTPVYCDFKGSFNVNHVKFDNLNPFLPKNDNIEFTQRSVYGSNSSTKSASSIFANCTSTTASSGVDTTTDTNLFIDTEQSSNSQIYSAESEISSAYNQTINVVKITSLSNPGDIEFNPSMSEIQKFNVDKFLLNDKSLYGFCSRIKFPYISRSSKGFHQVHNNRNESRTAIVNGSSQHKIGILSLRRNNHKKKRSPLLMHFPETTDLRMIYCSNRCNKIFVQTHNSNLPKSDITKNYVTYNLRLLLLFSFFAVFFYLWYLFMKDSFKPEPEPEHWYFFKKPYKYI